MRDLRGAAGMAFEGIVRGMTGCFILSVALLVGMGSAAWFRRHPVLGRVSAVGPRGPIPSVSAAALVAGRGIYQREECSGCHTLSDAKPGRNRVFAQAPPTQPGVAPDLTHEGLRNPSIAWQMTDLRDHYRVFPGSTMPDYTDLSPGDLRALASYLATRE